MHLGLGYPRLLLLAEQSHALLSHTRAPFLVPRACPPGGAPALAASPRPTPPLLAAAALSPAGQGKKEEDINAELGVGGVAADAELDAMKEESDAQLLGARGLLGPYARLVSALCHSRLLERCDPGLRGAALLALTKLMVVDPRFCEDNLQLLFTLLQNK